MMGLRDGNVANARCWGITPSAWSRKGALRVGAPALLAS